jgi:MFS transporter, PPP family, 3-phenylpropionic acid transporter
MPALRVLKTYNYFYFSLLSLFISFLPVYLSARGMSASQIGAITGGGALIGIFAQPFWGYQSDKHRTVRKILLLMLVLSVGIGTALFTATSPTVLFLLAALLYFFYLPADPLTESLNFRLSEKLGSTFGAVRMFGAIGFASTSLIVGVVTDHFGLSSFAVMFFAYGLLAVLLCFLLPDVSARSQSVALKDLVRFVRNRETVLFFTLVILTALPHRMNDAFLGVYLHSLGASTSQIGLGWFVAAVSETTFFALSARLLRNGNEGTWIAAAGVLYVVRYLLCAVFPSPTAVILLQLLQGVTFVIFYTSSLQYLNRTVPAQWQATGTTLLAILFFGVSSVIGSWLGGWIFDAFGGPALYYVMAVLSLAGFLFAAVYRKQITS